MARVQFLGIDPGLSGAVALLTVEADNRESVTSIQKTPVVWGQRRPGGPRRRRYDIPAMLRLLLPLASVSLCFLEAQGARPKQGRASIFTTGFGAGVWEALLVAVGIPHVVVPPQRWRKLVGLSGVDKEAVRLAAARRFPAFDRFSMDQADAAMLAVAARCAGLDLWKDALLQAVQLHDGPPTPARTALLEAVAQVIAAPETSR